jgi:hypothetical protein
VPQQLKRISLMIREDQYEQVNQKDLNLSGLVRDLIDDFLSEHKITLAVSVETKDLYDMIVSNTASSDSELEKYLRQSLKALLKEKIEYMTNIHKSL